MFAKNYHLHCNAVRTNILCKYIYIYIYIIYHDLAEDCSKGMKLVLSIA